MKSWKLTHTYKLVLVIFVIAFIIGTSSFSTISKTHDSFMVKTDDDYTVVKILNYNVLESGETTDNAWLNVVKEENPDIAMFIETGTWDDNNNRKLKQHLTTLNGYFPDEPPYTGYVTPNIPDSTAGAAIITRYPLVEAKTITEGYFDDNTSYNLYREVLHAVISIDDTNVHLLGVHFKCCGGSNEELLREKDMEVIINYMDSLGNVPIIYLGDFNSFSPYDTGELAPDPGNLGTGPISMLLNESNPHASEVHDWIDTYRDLNPHNPGYSYIDPIYESRIDFIFANDFFFDKLVNATVADTPSAINGSDHFPVDVTLNFDPDLIDLRPPVKPYGLNGSVIDDTTFNVTWDPNPEEDLAYYTVYRDNYVFGYTDKPFIVDNQIEAGYHYQYHISATDTSLNTGLNSSELIMVSSYGACTVPAKPSLSGYPGDHKTTLLWNITDDGGLPILEYRVYRRFVSADGIVHIFKATVPGSSLGYLDTENYNGNPADWVVTAVNALGESDYSNIATVTPSESADPMPTIPTTTISSTSTGSPPAPPSMTITISPTSSEISVSNSSSEDSSSSKSSESIATEPSTTHFPVLASMTSIAVIIYVKKRLRDDS